MANKKINELTALSALSDDSLVAIGDPGTGILKKMTVGALRLALSLTENTRNRFQEIYFDDADDNVVIKDTTDFTGNRQFLSPSGELLLQLGPAETTVITPPVDPEVPDTPQEPVELDIAWTLSENEPDFLDLNLVFRDSANGDLSNHYIQGSGLVGDGGVKPKSGDLMRAEVTYDGGQPSGESTIPVWDGPVRVTLTVRKNGLQFGQFKKEYPTPPAAGSLGSVAFPPTEFDTWTVDAKAERYTVPDEINDVDVPPVPVVEVSFVGGTNTITGGEAVFFLSGAGSYDDNGDTITHRWSSSNPDVTFSTP